jgi:hypothetical protein
MPIYQDRFAPGDLVTWRSDDYAKMTGGRDRFGNRLTIKEVHDAPGDLRHRGHTQIVTLYGDPEAGFGTTGSCFSGAFFRHLSEQEKRSCQPKEPEATLT